MPRVFIHCGLHKTGTTAIQNAFAAHRDLLRQHGVLYPRADPHNGHHNLAWSLTGDLNFDPAGITWPQVIDEIAAYDGDTVLSSEDFESCLHRPGLLSATINRVKTLGRHVCLVIYLRNRDRYIESLYLELLKHGYATGHAQYRRQIYLTGHLHHRAWVFQFDYDRLLAALKRGVDADVTIRPYQESFGDSIVPDFLEAIGQDRNRLGAAAYRRENQRLPFAESLKLFFHHQSGAPPSAAEAAVIQRLCPRRSGPVPATASGWSPQTADRVFAASTIRDLRRIAALECPAAAGVAEQELAAWWRGAPTMFGQFEAA